MKRFLSFCLIIMILISPVFSHSGRTDENGGHNGPGGYHYHHGYPEHQHADGICPYNFDDKTGQNSGTSMSGTKSDNSRVQGNSIPVKQNPSISGKLVFLVVLAFLFLLFACNCLAYLHEKIKYSLQYKDIPPTTLANMPDAMEIGSDGLPRIIGETGWGTVNTFYRTAKGRSFHCKAGCSGATHAIHAVDARLLKPCKRCNPLLPDLSWYDKYLEIKAIKEKYKIK